METRITKVLIADDSAEFGTRLADVLRNNGLYAYTRQRDPEIVIRTIAAEKPDAVISGLTLRGTDITSLMKNIKAAAGCSPAFIVVSDIENSFIERQVISAGALYCTSMPVDTAKLTEVLMGLSGAGIGNRDIDIEIRVTDIIRGMGMPAHLKGYHFLRSAILRTISSPDLIDSVTKQLYPLIASEYSSTASRVERAIRHAIDTAWERADQKHLDTFFGCPVNRYRDKPTNSELIALVADRIRLEIKKLNDK